MKTLKHFILISCLFLTSVGISYAATAVTINFEDSNGDPITSGATLTYYDSGWKTATNNNDGTFTANINGSSTSYHMVYANSSQTIVTSDNPVIFSTVATTAIVKDSDGNTLSGGTFSYYGNGWSSSYAAGTEVEILPGNFSVRMN